VYKTESNANASGRKLSFTVERSRKFNVWKIAKENIILEPRERTVLIPDGISSVQTSARRFPRPWVRVRIDSDKRETKFEPR